MSSSVLPVLQVQLNRYGLPVILILGNIGNIFIVLLFSKHRRNACSMYLKWAAVMNSAFITLNIPIALYTIDYGDPTVRSEVFCKVRFYLYHAWGQISRYLLVLACADRFWLTSHQARFRFINRPSVSKRFTGIIFICWHTVSIHIPILTTISNGRCGPTGVYYMFYYSYLLVFVCLIPATLMIICACLTYRNMKQLHTRVQPVAHAIDGSRGNITIHRRDRELLLMVLMEAAIYVVTTFIYPFIIMEVSVTAYAGVKKSVSYLQIESFISNFGTLLIYFNSAVPFYTYFVISKPFRQEFKKLFTRWIRSTNAETNVTEGQRTRPMQT
jgi:hypothetical protein